LIGVKRKKKRGSKKKEAKRKKKRREKTGILATKFYSQSLPASSETFQPD